METLALLVILWLLYKFVFRKVRGCGCLLVIITVWLLFVSCSIQINFGG
jgi:hypothetical protein